MDYPIQKEIHPQFKRLLFYNFLNYLNLTSYPLPLPACWPASTTIDTVLALIQQRARVAGVYRAIRSRSIVAPIYSMKRLTSVAIEFLYNRAAAWRSPAMSRAEPR